MLENIHFNGRNISVKSVVDIGGAEDMNKMIKRTVVLTILLFTVFVLNCYAITDADVQAAVDAGSKESVSGNLFIWFLCAMAFMKVSQKIDSFMSSLGISVGRTGGSMMGEAMIVAKTIGTAFKGGGFAGFGKSSSGGTNPAGNTGVFGGIGRKMTDEATGSVTGKVTGGGMMASVGKKMYENSVGKGGAFATSVISSVARGEINKIGTISGANGKAAMESYFGYNANATVDKKEGTSSKLNVEQGGSTTVTQNSNIDGTVGFDASGQAFDSDASSIEITSMGGADISSSRGDNIPSFSEIEMGGGRITGMETSVDHPDGIQFAMYDAEKYSKPEGKFETVTAVDNSKWYKQYATPTVEKTPYMDAQGKVQYNEKIIERIPKAPIRKDKM